MPRRAKRTYLALIVVGFLCWLVGLVGVAGTTATCPELPGGYEAICREHLRITWFRCVRICTVIEHLRITWFRFVHICTVLGCLLREGCCYSLFMKGDVMKCAYGDCFFQAVAAAHESAI